MGKYIVGITGASGSIYGDMLIGRLLEDDHEVFVVITDAGKLVVESELGWSISSLNVEETTEYLRNYYNNQVEKTLHYHSINSIGANIASGSFRVDGMIVLPCSMGTVSSIAHGSSHNLLERAADVIIKEKKKLIIVPREAPLSSIHLQNLLTLTQCNVVIMPASPSFYNKPKDLKELIEFFIGRIFDQLGLDYENMNRWEGI